MASRDQVKRWLWRGGIGLLVLALLTGIGIWLGREIPERLRRAEETLRTEAARRGLAVSYKRFKIRFLYPHVSLEDVRVDDAVAGRSLLAAESVEISLSLSRLLSGETPVSRVRIRNYSFKADEENKPLFTRLTSSERDRGGGTMPEIHLIGGYVRLGPLSPVVRWNAFVPEVRIREARFLGTHLQASVERASGELDLPGEGRITWPFPSAEVDVSLRDGVARVRRLVLEGHAASIRVSGRADLSRRSGDLKLSGEADLARWIAAGAPGGPLLARFAKAGKIDFSAGLAGTPGDPSGSAKVVLRQARLSAGATVDAEADIAMSNRKVRITSLRGKLWRGTLQGSGFYELATGRGEAALTVSRVSAGDAPWREWGFAWRPAGPCDAALSVSGGPGGIAGTVSIRNPGGVERTEPSAGSPAVVRIPLSADLKAVLVPGKELTVTSLGLAAGPGRLSAQGAVSLPDRTLDLTGSVRLPPGAAADYGWAYPLSWKAVSGDWRLTGPAARPRIAGRIGTAGLAARDLPSVPLVLKMEGDSGDLIHFVADIPAEIAKATASGTMTGPLASAPFLLEATVAARDIDLSGADRWVRAVMTSLGSDPRPSARYVEGLSGKGTGDFSLSVGRDSVAFSGSLSSDEIRRRDVSLRGVRLAGGWTGSKGPGAWTVQGSGELEGGRLRLSGEGEGETARVSGVIEGIDIAKAMVLLRRDEAPFLRGKADLNVLASAGPKGWEIARIAVKAPRIGAGSMELDGVAVEGSLGQDSGRITASSTSPPIRLAAAFRREPGWPAAVDVSADNVPTAFLLGAGGRNDRTAGGSFQGHAEGTVLVAGLLDGKTPLRDVVSGLKFSVSADSPRVKGLMFDEWRMTGEQDGRVLSGQIRTSRPDTRLAYSVSLHEPFAFRVEGPFSLETAENGTSGNGSSGNGASGNGAPGGGSDANPRFSVSGQARISGSLRAVDKASGSLVVNRFRYRNGGIDLAGKEISASLDAEGVRLTGGTVEAGGNPLRVSGRVAWGGALDVRLSGKVPAAAIRLVTDVFDRLDGTIAADLRLTGQWNDPVVVGTGHLEDGLFSFRGYAQLFEEMTADAVVSREKVIFERFEGRSGGGSVEGWGELPLAFDARQRMYFSVDFIDMRYPYPEEFTPVVQGHVEILGPVEDILITGEAEVLSAHYAGTVQPEKALLDVRRRLVDVRARRREDEFRIRLDINGVADGTIRIKNNLADAQVKGEFKIVGDTSRVIVLGSFDVLEGTVDFRGNKYQIRKLVLDFQDPRRNNPRIDARAETKKGNVTLAVSVTGTLDKYEVDLSSDPPLSKNDIVSLLSLGVTAEALAGAEGSVGAATTASIALGPYKGRVEEEIRGIVGLDKFAIEPAFSSAGKSFESKFIVGKTFGDRLSVTVSTSVGSTPESAAAAEFKLRENIFLQGAWDSATSTREGDVGGDIKFKYRFKNVKDFIRRGGD